jgi:hypothetical protein
MSASAGILKAIRANSTWREKFCYGRIARKRCESD